MRVNVDEDLPTVTVEFLRDGGYEAVSVVQQGMAGCKDPTLWQAAKCEERPPVTAANSAATEIATNAGDRMAVLSSGPVDTRSTMD